jgi:hypothetical protein
LDTKKIIASVKMGETQGYLVDALHQEDFRRLLLKILLLPNPLKVVNLFFTKEVYWKMKSMKNLILWDWNRVILP